MNARAALWAVLLSMLAGTPLITWLGLRGGGCLDGVGPQTFETVKYVLLGLTLIFYFVVSPFVIWPRLFGGACTYGGILRRGREATGRVLSVGERGAEHVRIRGRPHTYLEMEVEVRDAASVRTVRHLALVPDAKINSVRDGMDVPVRVCPDDPENLAIEWDRVIT